MISSFNELRQTIRRHKGYKISVPGAGDETIIRMVKVALKDNLISGGVLFGDSDKIKNLMEEEGIDGFDLEVVHEKAPQAIMMEALAAICKGKANLLVKGLIDTQSFMKGILHKEYGLKTGKMISDVTVYENVRNQKFLFITDPSINIVPDVAQKLEILKNALELCHILGIDEPKVAILSFTEKIDPNNQNCLDAITITKMFQRGQVKGAIVDGPLSLDIAIDPESAKTKNITGLVAGNSDLLLVPDLEVGNALAKSLSFMARVPAGGLLMGTRVPVVLTSRASSIEEKINSIMLASYVALQREK